MPFKKLLKSPFNVFRIAPPIPEHYSNKLKIDTTKCIGCAKCVKLCPMDNIKIENDKAVSLDKCTMCYRCINHCPTYSITLLGKSVVEQSLIEKYLD